MTVPVPHHLVFKIPGVLSSLFFLAASERCICISDLNLSVGLHDERAGCMYPLSFEEDKLFYGFLFRRFIFYSLGSFEG
jgi:hypothetical protein